MFLLPNLQEAADRLLSNLSNAGTARTNLGLGSVATHAYSEFDLSGAAAAVSSSLATHVANVSNPHSVTKSQVGLGSVENTALSTWAGSANLTTLGTVGAGAWQSTAIGVLYGGTGATTASGARTNLGLGSAATLNANNSANNLPILNSLGQLATSVLPPLSISTTQVVSSQAAMLALTAEQGDVAVRSDTSKTYILAGSDPTILGNWQELLGAGESPVQSVAGRVGTIVLANTDISGLGTASTHASTDFEPAITAGTTAQYWRGDKSWQTLTIPTAANPSATIGLSVVNGSASTLMRSDGAPALSQAIVPTWTGQHTFSASGSFPIQIGPSGNSATHYALLFGAYHASTAYPQIVFNNNGSFYAAMGVSTVGDLIFGTSANATSWTSQQLILKQSTGGLGIGYTPLSGLDVSSVAIGTFAGANAAPPNGMIVSGSVGIGTATTVAKLDIAAGALDGVRITTTNQTPFGFVLNNLTFGATDATAFAFYQRNDGRAVFYNNNFETISLTPAGNVGINGAPGTGVRLYVNGASTFDGTVNAVGGYKANGTAGVSGTATAVNTLTIVGGIVTNIA